LGAFVKNRARGSGPQVAHLDHVVADNIYVILLPKLSNVTDQCVRPERVMRCVHKVRPAVHDGRRASMSNASVRPGTGCGAVCMVWGTLCELMGCDSRGGRGGHW
jgi:hypothetical protein